MYVTQSVLSFIVSPLIGLWSDRVGRKPVLLFCQTVALVSLTLIAVAIHTKVQKEMRRQMGSEFLLFKDPLDALCNSFGILAFCSAGNVLFPSFRPYLLPANLFRPTLPIYPTSVTRLKTAQPILDF
jgi:MFS family permease